jgi:GT2 family glycosyltransferase
MVGRKFEILGWRAEEPFHLEAASKTRIERLIQTCEEEIALIDDEIHQFAIPYPDALPPMRRRFEVDVQESQTAAELSSVRCASAFGCESGRSADIGLWSRIKWMVQLLPIGFLALTSTRRGPVVIVGADRRARALAAFLRFFGRDSIRFESGYGSSENWIVPGVLRRPGENSFFRWLLIHPSKRLSESGAIVFLDHGATSNDLAPLVGLEHCTPPIVLPAAQALRNVSKSALGAGYVVIPAGSALDETTAEAVNEWPKISVVTVSYNQVRYIEETLRSVLDQGYPNLEYIVVDGGSTDGSIEIIEKYRPRLAHVIIEPDDGQSDALNKGFRLATGEIMNWLCSDDLVEPGALMRIGDAYRRFKPDIIVGACVRIGGTRDAEITIHHNALLLGRTSLRFDDMLRFTRSWQKSNYFFQPEVFFSRRIWESSGAFLKKHLYYAMDYDLWLRMAMAGATVMHVPDIIGCSRVHDAQKTRDDRIYLHQLRQIMEEYRDLLRRVSDAL